MWIKDLRIYEIEVYENGTLIYSGSVEEAPENIRNRETKTMSFEKKNIRIEV